MNERHHAQPAFVKLVKQYGYSRKENDAWICRHCYQVNTPDERGRWDNYLSINGHSAFAEVKAGNLSLPFSAISPEQREWQKWSAPRTRGSYWLYFELGFPRGEEQARDYPRAAFLVPWGEWLEVEAVLLPYQASLPYSSTCAKLLAVREAKLTAVELLSHRQLGWQTGGWALPEKHSFREVFHIEPV